MKATRIWDELILDVDRSEFMAILDCLMGKESNRECREENVKTAQIAITRSMSGVSNAKEGSG